MSDQQSVQAAEAPSSPRLNRETLRGFRVYTNEYTESTGTAQTDAHDDSTVDDQSHSEHRHVALWAVHGDENEREVEYPVASYTGGYVTWNSADPTFGAVDGKELPDGFYKYLASAFLTVVQSGDVSSEEIESGAPASWRDDEVWAAKQLLGMFVEHETPPFEAAWAIDVGMQEINEMVFGDTDE